MWSELQGLQRKQTLVRTLSSHIIYKYGKGNVPAPIYLNKWSPIEILILRILVYTFFYGLSTTFHSNKDPPILVVIHWRLFWHGRLSVQIRMIWVSYAYYNWWIPYGMMSVRMLSSCQNEINSPIIRMKMKQYLMSIVELPRWKCNPDWQHVILFNLRIVRHFSDLFLIL